MLAFYDFPAEHWKHLRTSNPVESTFATVNERLLLRRAGIMFQFFDAPLKVLLAEDPHVDFSNATVAMF